MFVCGFAIEGETQNTSSRTPSFVKSGTKLVNETRTAAYLELGVENLSELNQGSERGFVPSKRASL